MKPKLKRKTLAVLLSLFLAFWSLPVYADGDPSGEQTPPPDITVETETPPKTPESAEIPDDEIPFEFSPEEPSEDGDTVLDLTGNDQTVLPEEQTPEEESSEVPVPKDSREADSIIDVVVPPNGEMFLNPYELLTEVEGVRTTAQITHNPQALVNNGEGAVAVNVRVIGTVPEESGAVLVSAPPAGTPDKEIFLYTEFQSDLDAWAEGYTGANSQVIVTAEGTEAEDVLTLDSKGEGYFKVFGVMAKSPDAAWEKTDTFKISLVFSFNVIDNGESQTIMDTAPENPAEPVKPIEPENPTDPMEPMAPETPVEPTEPTEPENPTAPVEPTDPEEPKEPTEPTEPENPENPDTPEPPVTPEEPAEPTVPETPTEPETPQEPEESPDPDTPSKEPVEPDPTENTDVQEPPVTPEQA